MKVTFEHKGIIITVEFQYSDVLINKLLEVILDALVVYGYHPESIKRSVTELAKEYLKEEEKTIYKDKKNFVLV